MGPGEVGVVYFERDELPFTYHGDPGRTAAAQHPDHPNWATVGDLGYLDEDRFLYLTDRQSHMIISGGVNIYPREVEDVLALHPSVDDVAVIGVPDEDMGEAVLAVVQPAPGAATDAPRRGPHRLHPRAAGPLHVPDAGRAGRRAATHADRQAAQARAPAPVLAGGRPVSGPAMRIGVAVSGPRTTTT